MEFSEVRKDLFTVKKNYPPDIAPTIAMRAVCHALDEHPKVSLVRFVLRPDDYLQDDYEKARQNVIETWKS